MAFFSTKVAKIFIFCALAYTGVQFMLKSMPYTISPKQFRTFAEKVAGRPINQALQPLAQELRSKYGPHIVAGNELEWIPITIDGLNLQFCLLNGAATEYAGIWGTQLGTDGHLGTHWANQSCVVLSGAVSKASGEGMLGPVETFETASNFRLNNFESTHIKLGPETYVACYGRGFLPLSMAHIKIGTLFHAGDVKSFVRFLYRYGVQYTREQAIFFYELFERIKKYFLNLTQ